MHGQDYQGPAEPADPPDTTEQRRPLSRRSVLGRAAGFGAVGLAVAAGGGVTAAAMSSRSHGNSSQSHGGSAVAATGVTTGSGPIVIYMADPGSGEMQIFSGTGQTRHTNRAMTAMVASMAPR